MTIHNAVTNKNSQSPVAKTLGREPITLQAGTIIWSADGIPVAEIARRLHEPTINWFAQEDGFRTEDRELSPQFFEAINLLS